MPNILVQTSSLLVTAVLMHLKRLNMPMKKDWMLSSQIIISRKKLSQMPSQLLIQIGLIAPTRSRDYAEQVWYLNWHWGFVKKVDMIPNMCG